MVITCPHCQNVIDTDAAAARGDTVCPVCGSGIQLTRGSTADWEPPDGERVGRFELLAAVGHGAFSTVYKARDPDLDRVVAVKVPRPGRLADPHARARFAREARSAAQLHHPGIVPVLEVGQVGDTPFVVSEFVPGLTLSDWLSARRPTPTQSAGLIADLADALQYAHDRGVIHRDVKPANILIEDPPDGRPRTRLTDFGLARRDAGEVTLTQHGQVMGTPAYMSPEQARGESRGADGRCDVYSLGVILYEMLTGGLPFRGTQRMLLHQVLHDDPRPPRSLNDRIPRDLETVCLKALAKEPAERYQTAGEMAADLRRFLDHRPILARPVGRLGRARRWARRNPDLAGATALTAAAVLAAVAVAVAYGVHEYRAAAELRRERDNTRAALHESEQNRGRSVRLSARLALDQGLILCESGEVGPGLVWLARSLELAPAGPEGDDLRHAVRRNLSAWARRLHALERVIPHPGRVTAVAVSPDGRTLLTGCGDGTARLWDPDTGEPKGSDLRHGLAVRAVAFHPGGRLVVTGGDDGTARLWDAQDGARVGLDMAHPGGVLAVAFSPDRRLVATGGADGTVRLWDAQTGRPDPKRPPLRQDGPVRAVAFSPDGKTLVAVGGAADPEGGEVRLWEVENGRPAGRAGQRRTMNAVAFRPDGRRFLTADADWHVLLWDPDRLETPAVGSTGDETKAVAFHPDGRRLATGDAYRHTAVLWAEVPPGQIGPHRGTRRGLGLTAELLPWEPFGPSLPHRGRVNAVTFTPDGKAVVTGSDDWTARVWKVAPESYHDAEFHPPQKLTSLTFSRDGMTIASARRDEDAQIWGVRAADDRRPGDTVRARGSPIPHHAFWPPAFTPDGRKLLAIEHDGTVQPWDAATGQPAGTGWADKAIRPVKQIAVDPVGETVLVTSSDPGTIQIYDASQERLLATRSHPKVGWAAFGPDGRTVVSASPDGTVHRWQAPAWEPVGRPLRHPHEINQMALRPDGRVVLLSGTDGVSRLYRLDTGQPVGPPLAHQGEVWWATFSPNGHRAVTCSADQTARIWDADTGEPVGTPLQHQGPVGEAYFSPDGKLIVTGSMDTTARLWDVATSQPIGPAMVHPKHVEIVAFSRTGKTFATGSWDGTARLWAVPPAVEGDVRRVVGWVEVITGLEMAEGNVVRRLDPIAWADRRRRQKADPAPGLGAEVEAAGERLRNAGGR